MGNSGLLELVGGFGFFSVAYFWLKSYTFYQLQLFPGVGLSVNLSLSDMATVISALASIAAVSVAVRALRHNRTQDRLANYTNNAAADAVTNTLLKEYGDKFIRAFDEIHEQGERFYQHDKECAADKASLRAEHRQITEALQALTHRVESLNRAVGYLANDYARGETDRRLGVTEKKEER